MKTYYYCITLRHREMHIDAILLLLPLFSHWYCHYYLLIDISLLIIFAIFAAATPIFSLLAAFSFSYAYSFIFADITWYWYWLLLMPLFIDITAATLISHWLISFHWYAIDWHYIIYWYIRDTPHFHYFHFQIDIIYYWVSLYFHW
jgi:hypothetical protein